MSRRVKYIRIDSQSACMRALIAYYSFKGATEKAAELVSQYLSAKGYGTVLERIIPKKEYSTMTAYSLGRVQAKSRSIIELEPRRNDVSEFDLLVVMTPTWAWTCAPPAYSFVSKLPGANEKQKALAISTCQSSPGDGPAALAKVLSEKGFEVIGTLSIGNIEKANEELKKLRV